MLQEKTILCNKLKTTCEKIVFDKEKCNKIVETINNNYNIPTGIIMDMIAGRSVLEDVPEFFLYAITENILPKQVNSYFTPVEINEYSKMKFEEPKIKFPLIIKCEQVNRDQWIGVVDVDFFMNLRKAQLINYNVNAQRTLRKKKRGNSIVYQISLNTAAIKSITGLMKNNIYIPNTITLNIPYDSEADFRYDEESRELIINSINHFDISDGYHRYISICQLKDQNDDFNYPIELRVINFGDEKVRQFIYQEDQKTKMRRIDSDSMNMNAPSNIVCERLNSDILFNLKGKISRNDGLINQGDFSETIKYFYFNNKSNAVSNKEIIIAQKDIRDKFNYLTEINPSYLERNYSRKDLMIIMYCFSKYAENYKDNYDSANKTFDMINKQDLLNNTLVSSGIVRKATIRQLEKMERGEMDDV